MTNFPYINVHYNLLRNGLKMIFKSFFGFFRLLMKLKNKNSYFVTDQKKICIYTIICYICDYWFMKYIPNGIFTVILMTININWTWNGVLIQKMNTLSLLLFLKTKNLLYHKGYAPNKYVWWMSKYNRFKYSIYYNKD